MPSMRPADPLRDRVIASLLLLAIALFASLALAAGPNRLYRNDSLRVRGFESPPGWTVAPQSSYPGLLVLLNHADGSRITFTAQRLTVVGDAAMLAARAKDALSRQGFTKWKEETDARDASRVRLTASFDAGKRQLRQVYVVDRDIGYVVTLMTAQEAPERISDFETAVHTLAVGAPEREHVDADGGLPR